MLPLATHRATSQGTSGCTEALAPQVRIVEDTARAEQRYTVSIYSFRKERAMIIDDRQKAQALLTLFDRTVSQSGTGAVPRELAALLARVAEVAPAVTSSPIYRLLSKAARRRM